MIHSTTILALRHRERAVLAGDGQVTFGDTIVKQSAKKIRRLYNDKILAGWNGPAISALAETGRALGASHYVEAATGAADFVLSALGREDGRLLRSWRDGRTSGPRKPARVRSEGCAQARCR